MPRIKFTDRMIQSLRADTKSVEYFDASRDYGTGSFGIRVSPKGRKVWFIMYQNQAGKIKRYSLSKGYPELGLKDARAEANDKMGQVHAGEDLMQAKVDRKRSPTMTDLWSEYLESLARKKSPKAASTIREETRKWEKVIAPAIGSLKVQDITPMDISAILNKLAMTSPVSANRLHSQLRVMFKVAMGNGWIKIHPMQWLDKPGGAEPPRKRVLSDEEIKILWFAFDNLRPNPRDALKIGLLTAQRPGEILRMKWEDVDLDKRIWIVRNTKTGNDHLVPLSPQVSAILQDRKDGVGYSKRIAWMLKSEFVFPSRHNVAKGATTGHAGSTKDVRWKLQQATGISGWTAHDLRRTARTLMSRLKIKQHIREIVLNHSQGGVVGVYDQHDYLQEKADALTKLANEIDRIIGIKKIAKIIELKTAAQR